MQVNIPVQVSPKFTFWFGVWTSLIVFIGSSPDQLQWAAVFLPAASAVKIIAGFAGACTFFGKINGIALTALVGLSSAGTGPLTSATSTTQVGTGVAKIIMLCVALRTLLYMTGAACLVFVIVLAGPAQAQDQQRKVAPRPEPMMIAAATAPVTATDKSVDVFPCLTPPLIDLRPACNGGTNVGATPTQKTSVDLWNKIVGAAKDDLIYAVAMATSAAKGAPQGITSAAGMRLACLQSIQTLNAQSTGANLTGIDGKPLTRPTPSLFTDAETMMEILDAVQPGGPLWTSCAGAAQLAGTSVVAFINALLAGAAGVAALSPIK